jgi:hypothetical protein
LENFGHQFEKYFPEEKAPAPSVQVPAAEETMSKNIEIMFPRASASKRKQLEKYIREKIEMHLTLQTAAETVVVGAAAETVVAGAAAETVVVGAAAEMHLR